jgi:hypothetical protein
MVMMITGDGMIRTCAGVIDHAVGLKRVGADALARLRGDVWFKALHTPFACGRQRISGLRHSR